MDMVLVKYIYYILHLFGWLVLTLPLGLPPKDMEGGHIG